MHIHLPKALRGWRDFAKEVGIIVVGVLIALSAEQLVQQWHWYQQVKETRKALTSEIEYSVLFAMERSAVQPCLRTRITYLATKLNNGRSRWAAEPLKQGRPRVPIGRVLENSMPYVYRVPHRPWLSDEWETAKSTGVLGHMDRGEVRTFEFIFQSINELRTLQEEETSLVPELTFLSFSQELPQESRIRAITTLARLDQINSLEAVLAEQILLPVEQTHMPLPPMRLQSRTASVDGATRQMLTALRDRYGSCVVDVRLAK